MSFAAFPHARSHPHFVPRPPSVIAGQRFGELTAVCFERIRHGSVYWICRCSCGHELARSLSSIRARSLAGYHPQCATCAAKRLHSRMRFAHEIRNENYRNLWAESKVLYSDLDVMHLQENTLNDLIEAFGPVDEWSFDPSESYDVRQRSLDDRR